MVNSVVMIIFMLCYDCLVLMCCLFIDCVLLTGCYGCLVLFCGVVVAVVFTWGVLMVW